VIKELNENSIGISKVKRSRAVSVGFDGLLQGDTVSGSSSGHQVNVLGSANNESNVMDVLNRSGLCAFGQLMNCEIIASGSQIDIVRIGLPFDLHTQNIAVKVDRVANIPDIEGNMPKT